VDFSREEPNGSSLVLMQERILYGKIKLMIGETLE